MLKSLKIDNFRCFPSFELAHLGRINLLVGKNNSGKTSILEAIQLLTSPQNLGNIHEIMVNRGEYFWNDDRIPELDISHLFCGHEITTDSRFSLTATDDVDTQMRGYIDHKLEDSEKQENILYFKMYYPHLEVSFSFPLSVNQGVIIKDYLRYPSRDSLSAKIKNSKIIHSKIQFITSASLETEKMIDYFEDIVLTPEEEIIIQALRLIEPNIERIAHISSHKSSRYSKSRNGFLIKLSGQTEPVPIGSMGDGIWRILGIVLAVVNAKDGFLLVDEIDTGLHFTTMSDMWKLVWETAQRLNVQVFATTHSNDCWQSLANIARELTDDSEAITIQRIEKNQASSIIFDARKIVIAAERDIEVR